MCVCLDSGGPAAFSPGNLSTSSSASSTLGSPDNDEYILSFETIDKMRRVSSYSSLNSLIGNNNLSFVLELNLAHLCVSFHNTLFFLLICVIFKWPALVVLHIKIHLLLMMRTAQPVEIVV